ncbi:ral GTPase-activating protein subunit alpha-1-like, partial [Tropilaelaps mercedesae]
MFRLKLIFWLVAAALTLEATCVQAKLARTDKQLWFPSVSGLVSRLPSLTAIASHLPSMPSLSSIQTLFSGGGGSSLLAPALADFGSYLSDTMPAFSDVYASIPSWSDWQGLLPNVPRPSTIYNQLPTE